MAIKRSPTKKTSVKKAAEKRSPTKKTSVKKAADMKELGGTGLRQYSGRLNEEFLNVLKNDKGRRIFREMRDNSPVVGAILFAIEMLIRSVKWYVQADDENNKDDIDAVEFIEGCLDDMSHTWEDFISEVLSMLTYGWAYHEICYKVRRGESGKYRSKFDDGKVGWRKMPIRAQETLWQWEMDEDGGIAGMHQLIPTNGLTAIIPIDKALLFRTTSFKNSPEGRSVLRNAYRPWYFGKRIEEIEAIGIERDLAGLPMMKVPGAIMSANASDDDKTILAACKEIIQNIRRDEQEGVIIPGDIDAEGNPLYTLELLSSGGNRQFDTSKILQRYDQRIAMVVLADFILLGHEKVGSFALSDNKTDLFATAIGAWLDEIASVFDRFAIPRLLKINGMRGKCKLKHHDIETPDLQKLSTYIKDLVASGAELFPDDNLENWLREVAGMPERNMDNDEFDEPGGIEEEDDELNALDPMNQSDDLTQQPGAQPPVKDK